MNDQERITDLILTEKKMSANYDTFASECVNVQLRDEFLKLLNQGHQPRPSSSRPRSRRAGIRWSRPRPARSALPIPVSATSAPSKANPRSQAVYRPGSF